MKTVIDHLPVVLASRLRALGEIGRETKTTTIRFDDSGVEFVVGVTSMRRSTVATGRCSVVDVAGGAEYCVCSRALRRVAAASGRRECAIASRWFPTPASARL